MGNSFIKKCILITSALLLFKGGYYDMNLTPENRKSLYYFDALISKIDDKYLLSQNMYLPQKQGKNVYTNDLFQYVSNLDRQKPTNTIDKSFSANNINYIIIDPYTRSFTNFPYSHFSRLYVLSSYSMRWEIWKKTQE